jgi:hypothetical protein
MLCVAVHFTEVCSLDLQDPETAEEVKAYWGSVPRSTLSLFMALFGGFDWRDGVDPLKALGADVHLTSVVVMCLYVAFASLVMLNLVTGLFVEGAQRIAKEDRDKELLCLAAHLFELGKDTDMEMGLQEFDDVVGHQTMFNFCESNAIRVEEVDMVFQILLDPQTGKVDIVEFVVACKTLQGEARAADLQAVRLMMRQCFLQLEESLSHAKCVGPRARHTPSACSGQAPAGWSDDRDD